MSMSIGADRRTGCATGSTRWSGPHPISVLEVEPVADDWHARFSCIGRRYLYRILNRRAPPALDAGRVWHVAVPLDVEAMREGAAHAGRAS